MRQGSRTVYAFFGSFALAAAVSLSGTGCDDSDNANTNTSSNGGAGGTSTSNVNTAGHATAESAGGKATSQVLTAGAANTENTGGNAAGGAPLPATTEFVAAGRAGASGIDELGIAGASGTDNISGIWQIEGYGYVAELGTDARLYEVSSVSCIDTRKNALMPDARELLGDGRLLSPYRAVFTSSERTLQLTALRRDTLPELCRNGGTATLGDSTYQRTPRFVFDVLWNTFSEQYAFFETRGVDWGALRESYRARIKDTTSDEELFELLANLIRELDDGHVNLGDLETGQIVNAASVPPAHQAFYETYQAQTEVADWSTYLRNALEKKQNIIKNNYLGARQQQAANGALRWGKLDTATGYLGIDEMAGYTTQPDASLELELNALSAGLDQAFDELADTKNLVIDVRFNGGGYDQASLAILSRLIKTPLDVFTKRARNGAGWTEAYTARVEPSTRKGHPDGKIVVLTSALTASAAEIFTMGTLGIPGLVRIGEATEGVFSDVLIKTLPNLWLFTLSNERYEDPHGHCYEGEGIPVHQQVGLLIESDLQQGKDTALDAALRTMSE